MARKLKTLVMLMDEAKADEIPLAARSSAMKMEFPRERESSLNGRGPA